MWTRAQVAGIAAAMAAVGVAGTSAPAGADPAGVFRVVDWENAADRTVPASAPPGFTKQWGPSHGVTNVASPVRDGRYAARFQLNRGDSNPSGSRRSEISQRDEQPVNAERWYGFSLNLPSGWAYDTSAEIVSQWHQCDNDCAGGSPPLALLTDEGRWKIDFRGTIVDLGPYTTGKWTDWVFHVRWRTNGEGVVEAWRDGAKVFERTGANHPGGPRSPYFKFGIYKWDWANGKPSTTSERVMFYDALRLADQRAGYDDVRPGAGACAGTLPVAGASATTSEPINPPAQAIDGNLSTRWSGQGFGASLILDLGAVRRTCGTRVAWHLGDQRWNDYTVYTSVDGVSYTKAWEGRSKGTSTAPEQELFTGGAVRDARYLKISFWQNPQNDWASITEAAVLGS